MCILCKKCKIFFILLINNDRVNFWKSRIFFNLILAVVFEKKKKYLIWRFFHVSKSPAVCQFCKKKPSGQEPTSIVHFLFTKNLDFVEYFCSDWSMFWKKIKNVCSLKCSLFMFLPWRQGRNKVPALLGRARNGRGVGELGVKIIGWWPLDSVFYPIFQKIFRLRRI